MAMKPYPSNTLIFYVDERVLTEEIKLAIRRSWTHIGETLVRSHPASEGDPCNFVHVMVKYGTRKYLASDGGEADENWSERMEQHLASTMRKFGNNMIAFNRHQRKVGEPELCFDHIEFSLEAGALLLEFRLDSNGSLPVSCAQVATRVRTALGEGSLGEPSRVRIPSMGSYERQALAAARARAEAERLAAEEEERRLAEEESERAALEADREERFMESPELVAQVEAEEAQESSRSASPLEVAPLTAEEWEAEYGIKEVDFEIVYDLWDVVGKDGSSREYDPEADRFLEEEGEE